MQAIQIFFHAFLKNKIQNKSHMWRDITKAVKITLQKRNTIENEHIYSPNWYDIDKQIRDQKQNSSETILRILYDLTFILYPFQLQTLTSTNRFSSNFSLEIGECNNGCTRAYSNTTNQWIRNQRNHQVK